MSLVDVEGVRRLVADAVAAREHRSVEQDQLGSFGVTTVSRPGFEALQRLAVQNPATLIAVFPSIESAIEKRAVCEALSEATDTGALQFWEEIVDRETDEELLSCAAVGFARQGQADPLEKLEAKQTTTTPLRLLFHLGIARLQLNDPRGVDHLVELLRRDPENQAVLTHGPTMRYIVVGLLKRIFHKGPGNDIPGWIEWWGKRRGQYRWIDSSAVPASELAYVPPLWAFMNAQS